SSASSSAASSTSSTSSVPAPPPRQPSLRKARSRHFDTFRNSSIINNSSSTTNHSKSSPTMTAPQPQLYVAPPPPPQLYEYDHQYTFQPASGLVAQHDLSRYDSPSYLAESVNRMPIYYDQSQQPPIPTGQPIWNSIQQAAAAAQQSSYLNPGSVSPSRTSSAENSIYISTSAGSHSIGPEIPNMVLGSDDYIPNAIVIKNIPFAAQVDDMNMLFKELGLELPYAFNYHFDNGVFRGLAFANFRNTTDTAKAIAVLNGYEYGGRKLRAEYKKMLPKEERDRAEHQKRLRRGQLEEQHRQQREREQAQFAAPISAPLNVNMNDPNVRKMYDQVLFFTERKDPLEELTFDKLPQSLRRAVHSIAYYFQNGHITSADGERVIIYKRGNPKYQNHTVVSNILNSSPQQTSGGVQSSAGTSPPNSSLYGPLSACSVGGGGGIASALLDYQSSKVPYGTLSKPKSPVRTLRNAKSFADIRSSSRLHHGMYAHQNSSSSSISSVYSSGHRASNVPAVPDVPALLA
ncbi:uncharacterized protein V1516DRAFT_617083, partial [Lipomyces oligophaga]|uniref:uncharacterized protein n=1 Tax=Lipomyces oligophaga TaxID=45792 RepID=UPI0034CDC066